MKIIKTIFFCILCILIVTPIFAQENTIMKGEKFRMRLKNGSHVAVKNGYISDNTLFSINANGQETPYSFTDIISMERRSGNRAATGALAGAGMGFLTALLAYGSAESEASSDPYKEINDDAIVPIFAICTGLGTAVGLIWGSTIDKWEKVPLEPSFLFNPKSGRKSLCLTFNF